MSDARKATLLAPCPFCGTPLERSAAFSTRGNDVYVHPVTDELCFAQFVIGSSDRLRIAAWNRRAAPTPPAAEAHPDDLAVDRFAAIMKAKLAVARDKGRGGWEDREQCPDGYLSQLLREHVEKGDPVDVANLAMMLSLRGERIAPPEPAKPWVPHLPGLTAPAAEAPGQEPVAVKPSELRCRLPGMSSPVMRGDNLAIVLASYYEPMIESEELDDSGMWKQGAIDAADEIMDAIHGHYTLSSPPTYADAEAKGLERGVIRTLLDLAYAAYLTLDDSEEHDAQTIIETSHADTLSALLDKLDALPDDRPGCTMGPAAKAEWALRSLASPAPKGET